MSTDDLVLRGSTALSVGDYDQAVAFFTQALVSNQTYDVLVQKARALTELNNFQSALTDLANAVALDATRPEAHLARGVTLFKQGEVKAAQEELQVAHDKSTASLQVISKRWLKKCDAELSNKDFKGSSAQSTSSTSTTTTAASTTVTKPVEEVKTSDKPKVADILSGSGKIAYTWYQTTKTVGIEINHSLPNKNDLKTVFEGKKIEVTFPIGNGSDYDLTLDLFDDIITETVKVTVHLSKIEIVMEKKNPDQSWKSLNALVKAEDLPVIGEATEKTTETTTTGPKKVAVQPVQPPSYPTSSLKKKNWDKIDMEIEEDIKKNKGDYCVSDDPMKGIFKQIYDASDENTKRAMMKSYLTSGGTVLSTNWDEVKDKDYEGKDKPEAPKGQEWRKWEK